MTKSFSMVEVAEAIKEQLSEGVYSAEQIELNVFNSDEYIIGTYEATQALIKYGVFDAIAEIKEFEKENFGESQTDLSNPEKVANMLWYIIGHEIMNELNIDNYDLEEEEHMEVVSNLLEEITER